MEQVREIYAVCHVNDVVKRRALGFVLARLNDAGEVVPVPIVVTRQAGKFYAYVNRARTRERGSISSQSSFSTQASAICCAASMAHNSTSRPAIATMVPVRASDWSQSRLS